jgi:acetone monooxygenase
VTTSTGEQVSTQFLVLNVGGLSEPRIPPFPGHDRFKGVSVHTSRWPREGVDLRGKRVGVIGTAATGIQVIQTIAADVSKLVVFQRTANYAAAMRNAPLTEEDREKARAAYEDLRERAHSSFSGLVFDGPPPLFTEMSPQARQERMQAVWADGSLRFWGGVFADSLSNPEAAECLSEFVRGKIREKVKDPLIAEKLMPRDYHFGTRRLPLEDGYFETFNRENVELVDLRADPILAIDEAGIVMQSGRHDLDVIIYATGFDAGIGAFNQIDIRGRDGRSLREEWAKSVRTTVGMQVHGFPNLFMTMAPFAPASAICNVPICTDQQVDWISDAIAFVRQRGARSIEPNKETEEAWMSHHEEVSEPTLLGQNKNSWYRLKDASGRQRELLAYVGGIKQYRAVCDEYRASGFKGFNVI